MTLPNVITLARLISVPVGIWLLLRESFAAGFWVILAAGVSDAVDGFLAKHLHMSSQLGAVLDPIADKTLLVGIFLTLGYQGYVETWLVILIVFRDLLIIGGAIVLQLLTGNLQISPTRISKVNTAAQIALAVLVVAHLAFEFDARLFVMSLTGVVAATTVLSGATYIVLWAQQLNGSAEAGADGRR